MLPPPIPRPPPGFSLPGPAMAGRAYPGSFPCDSTRVFAARRVSRAEFVKDFTKSAPGDRRPCQDAKEPPSGPPALDHHVGDGGEQPRPEEQGPHDVDLGREADASRTEHPDGEGLGLSGHEV